MTDNSNHHKFILLGASRGLGWSTFLKISSKNPQNSFLLVSRKIHLKIESIQSEQVYENTQAFDFDFSKSDQLDELIAKMTSFGATHIIYFAGGGPYGYYHDKKWSDHEWAFNVNFLTPAKLLHSLIQTHMNKKNLSLKQFIVVGSKIAENEADLKAASYCAAKHAMRGLIRTLNLENKAHFAIDLFSPGYFESDLLPLNSFPRVAGLAQKVDSVAEELVSIVR